MTVKHESSDITHAEKQKEKLKQAYFAGGCFWCTEHDLRNLKGIKSIISGYAGGDVPNPVYAEVCSGITGHREAVMITYNPEEISYGKLVDEFLRIIDPFDNSGQFFDRGFQYTNAIFFLDNSERDTALERIKIAAEFLNVKEIAAAVLPFKNFYEAEEYHQGFSEKNPARYCSYRESSGRNNKLKIIWNRDR